MLSQKAGLVECRSRKEPVKKSERAVRFWLALVSLVLVPLNLYSAFGGDAGRFLSANANYWANLTAAAIVMLTCIGMVYCWFVFLWHWWQDYSGNRAVRRIWPFVLVIAPYGLLLYYFFAYSGRNRHEKCRRNSGCSVIT